MQILPNSFLLPQNVRKINNEQQQTAITRPSFKSKQARLAKEIGEGVTKSLGLNGAELNKILSDPQKSKEFFGLLGATISATVISLYNLINGNENKEKNSDIEAIEHIPVKIEEKESAVEQVEFKKKKGALSKEEKEYITLVETKFTKNKKISDRLKLLFNKIGGVNRDNAHILNEETISNRELLAMITAELTENQKDTQKVKEIINKYNSLQAIDGCNIVKKPQEKKPRFKVKFPENIENIFKVRQPLSKKAYEIAYKSKTKEDAEKKVQLICNTFSIENVNLDESMKKKALTNIGTYYLENLEEIANVIGILPDTEKTNFYYKMANKELNEEALKSWNLDRQNKGLPFSIYNELKRLNINEDGIKQITSMKAYRRIIDFKIKDIEDMSFTLYMPTGNTGNSLNSNFGNIKTLFETVTGRGVNLRAQANNYLGKEEILKELEEDFEKNGKTTYENLIKYLYKSNHEVRYNGDFHKRQLENRFNYLIEALNNNKVFNPNFFSTHSKLRFIERYVVNENFGKIPFNDAVASKTRDFINDIGTALANGVEAKPYYAGDNIMGVQLLIPTKNNDTIRITLDDENKIHTII